MRNKAIHITINIICSLLIFLFVYAAISKWLDFDNFQAQLGQSPLLSAYTSFISVGVLVVELCIAVLLIVPKSKKLGLFLSFTLMVMFTAYIAIILNFSPYIPCSCGGILEEMNWKQHLLFNLLFVALAAFALSLYTLNDENKSSSQNLLHTVFKLVSITIISCSFIAILYITSNDIMAHENPFIRKSMESFVFKKRETDLNNYNFYVAGSDAHTVYLGNSKAPLQILAIDSAFKHKKLHTIQLEQDTLPFRSIQVRVQPPYFYVFDGTIPVIYKGNVADWKAKIIMNENRYFSKMGLMGTDTIAFTSQPTREAHIRMGQFTFADSIRTTFNSELLQAQIDGVFDTDGMMSYSKELHQIVYLYHYRNQYIVADHNLKVRYRGNTIDTTSRANIKPVYIKKSGERKLSAQPLLVNRKSTVSGNLLFVNAALRGRYEDDRLWKSAATIDVYNFAQKKYIASFHIYNIQHDQLSDLHANNGKLYTIVGRWLQQYDVNENVTHK